MNVLTFTALVSLAGAVLGALTARRRGGNRLDMAQHAGSFAILFALIGLFVGIFIMRVQV